ncbi:MAG: LysM domain-containing protein [Candidatus Sericytochromatia bacterium]|nr:LysM domain-containing protein [Candidatus Sericytochromatia bacterium]
MTPLPPQSVCPGCGHPVDATGTCTRCGARYTSLRMVRKQPPRGRGPAGTGPRRGRVLAWRLFLVLLLGVLLGIPIGYALPHGTQAPPSPGGTPPPSPGAPTPAPGASRPPAASPLPPRAPALRPANAPVAQPWQPATPARPAPATLTASGRPAGATRDRPSPAPRPASRSYVVRPGDTFAGIATKLYGTPGLAGLLIRANPGIDPRALPLGRSLVVPPAPPSPRPTPAARPPVASPSPGPKARPPRQAP